MRHFAKLSLCLLAFCLAAFAQSAALTPSPKQQFFDNSGHPLSGGLLYSYAAGTTTPQNTYTDSTGGTPNTNPVTLDSSGRAAVWLGGGLAYKLVLQTSAGVTIWTVDNVSGGPLDMVTTDTVQTISANKTFNGILTVQNLTVTGTCTGCGGGGGGGGSTAFSAITGGTNTTALMTLGSGSKLASTGTAEVNFASGAHTTPALVGLAASKPATCTVGEMYFASNATAGQNWYYCTATNTWTQQLNGAGGSAFSAISGGTNTGAAMLVGSGGSLGTTGSGTIDATSVVDANQNPILLANGTASAVDQITITNSAAGSPGIVYIAATGSDSNIDISVTGKGTGNLRLNSNSAYIDSSGNLTVVSCTGCAGGGSSLPVVDTTSIVKGNADNTKQMRFSVSGLTTGTTRVLTVPDQNITLAGLERAQTFSASQSFANTVNPSSSPSITATISSTASSAILTNNSGAGFGIQDLSINGSQFTGQLYAHGGLYVQTTFGATSQGLLVQHNDAGGTGAIGLSSLKAQGAGTNGSADMTVQASKFSILNAAGGTGVSFNGTTLSFGSINVNLNGTTITMPNGVTGPNGTFPCTGAQHINALILSYGLVSALFCS